MTGKHEQKDKMLATHNISRKNNLNESHFRKKIYCQYENITFYLSIYYLDFYQISGI